MTGARQVLEAMAKGGAPPGVGQQQVLPPQHQQQHPQYAQNRPQPSPSPHLHHSTPTSQPPPQQVGQSYAPNHASPFNQPQQSYVPAPSSAAPSPAFTIPTPASLVGNGLAPSPSSAAFAVPPPPTLGANMANFPLTSPAPGYTSLQNTPALYNVGLPVSTPPAGAGAGQTSMFATSYMPFPPTPSSDAAFSSSLPTNYNAPFQQHQSYPQQHPSPLKQPDVEPEMTIEELLATTRGMTAERLAEEAAVSNGQDSSTPKEQGVLSPAIAAAAAAGQVAPFSMGGVPSVTLSRTNSLAGRHQAGGGSTTPTPLAVPASPGGLATPSRPTLNRTVSTSSTARKRDREASARELDLTIDGGNGEEEDDDEGRRRQGSNPFQASPLSNPYSGSAKSGGPTPPGEEELSTPDFIATNARPETGSTLTGLPSPHSITAANDSTAASVSTPSSTAPTSSSTAATLATPSAALSASLNAGLSISTPPNPVYANAISAPRSGPSSSHNQTLADPFAALGALQASPDLGLGGEFGAGFGALEADLSVGGGGGGAFDGDYPFLLGSLDETISFGDTGDSTTMPPPVDDWSSELIDFSFCS